MIQGLEVVTSEQFAEFIVVLKIGKKLSRETEFLQQLVILV